MNKNRKYRVRIDMQGVRFQPMYGAKAEELVEKAKKEVIHWQKIQQHRQHATITLYEDTGKRYGYPSPRLRVDWQTVSTEKVPYEARPYYAIGDTFTRESEEDVFQTAEIIGMRIEPKYDDFYYTIAVQNGYDRYTEELGEYDIREEWKIQKVKEG